LAALNELNVEHLETRLAAVGITGVRSLPGGASSLTFAAMLGDQRVVVKVAPPGVMPTGHRDVLRQARMIRALGPTAVPVPAVLWVEAGDPPDEPPLFVMSHLDGSSVEPLFDYDSGGERTTMAGRMCNAARAMADLHRLVPSEIGLGAEPIAGPAGEIERWSGTLETVDPVLVRGWRQVATTLESTVPEALPPCVVHGDFRLGNLLACGDRIAGVIDWEIWSVGDPRIDVGWFLINADPDTYRRATPYYGATPAPSELAEVYTAALGCEVPDLDWFQGLACFKSAATWSLIVKHNRRRHHPDGALEAMAVAPQTLLMRAAGLLDGGTSRHYSTDGCAK
jgi:aminoglycoside phosphotransferase (APT) family kinase protein